MLCNFEEKYIQEMSKNKSLLGGGKESCSRLGTWRFHKDKKASFFAPS